MTVYQGGQTVTVRVDSQEAAAAASDALAAAALANLAATNVDGKVNEIRAVADDAILVASTNAVDPFARLASGTTLEKYGGGSLVPDNSAAFAAAAAESKIINLGVGTYTFKSTIVLVGKGWRVRGVPGLTKITIDVDGKLLRLGNFLATVSDVVIDDIIFETTFDSAAEDLGGLVASSQAYVSQVYFNRCKFDASSCNVNAVKLTADNAAITGLAVNGVIFTDCEIIGAGRMGIEVQNNSADSVVRCKNVAWRGGAIRNTGLRTSNSAGQSVSFTGFGTDCEVSNVVLDNAFGIGMVENAGFSNSRFINIRTQNMTRACDGLSFTSAAGKAMFGNRIEGWKDTAPINGRHIVYRQTGLVMRDNGFDCTGSLTGFFAFRDIVGLRSYNDKIKTKAVNALTIESATVASVDNQLWYSVLDNSLAATNNAVVRFFGTASFVTSGNAIFYPTYLKATGGARADQLSPGASGNMAMHERDGTGALFALEFLTVAMADANQDRTLIVPQPSTIRLTGALTANRTLTLPAIYRPDGGPMIINDCSGAFVVTVIAAGGNGFAMASGSKSRAVFNGTNMIAAS